MTVKDKKDIAGKALYLEFRKEQYTYQTIATPVSVLADKSGIVSFSILRRRISVWHPRRNWSHDLSREKTFARDAYGEFEKTSNLEDANEKANKILGGVYGNHWSSLVNQEWQIFKKPLAVEFTYEELDTIASGKMPVSLYRRIERVRKNQGWGEDLFNPADPTTV